MEPFSNTPDDNAPPETDGRFPSGPWRGFFLQSHIRPGRYEMDLHLTFSGGKIGGEGRDFVGPFRIRGSYDLETGICTWHKSYDGAHGVSYRGFNEGKGIWGTWEIPPGYRGGFQIWPSAWGIGGLPPLSTEEDLPAFDDTAVISTSEADELVVTTGRCGE